MSPSSTGSPASGTQWHAVTPQTRPLSIAILELAPTSVTLALTRSPPAQSPPAHHHTPTQHIAHTHGHGHHSHAHAHHLHNTQSNAHHLPVPSVPSSGASSVSNGHTGHGSGSGAGGGSSSSNKKKKKKRHGNANHHAESDDGGDDDDDNAHNAGAIPGAYPYSSILVEGQTFKDMLSHGVVVTLDGMPWSRIVAHVSDDADDDDGAPLGNSEDDDGEWEDDWEHAGVEGGEEGLANASSMEHGQLPRRRRRHRASDASRHHPMRRIKMPERQHSGPRWDRERAVVVVYDLDPSKEHEIELQIVGLAGEVKENLMPVSNAVLVPPASSTSNATLHPRSRANSLRSRSRPRSRSNSINTAATPIPPVPSPLGNEVPASPNRSSTPIPDQQVVPTSILSPIDAQTAQTRHLIAAAHAEREHLQVQIKEARKTAQRSEAALRTDIESMKRSNDKAGGNDQRNKQKYLALQEQVKQGWAGAETANKEADTVKASMPEIEAKVKSISADLEGVRIEWKRVKDREEEAREVDKKMRAEEDKKMVELDAKMDKIRARKEKKACERAELERRLGELEKQREDVERKAEENKAARARTGYYPGLRWDQPPGASNPSSVNNSTNATASEFAANQPNFDNGRTLSAHPSMSNLHQANLHQANNHPSNHHQQNNYPGTGFRPRGGFQHRYPSGGSRPPPQSHAQQSPTINQTFFPASGAPPSPAWQAKTGNQERTRGGSNGPNPTAAPFLPSTFSSPVPGAGAGGPGGAPFGDPALHTAFMPPQLQHRIYLPNSVRPRPTPNFHPPPSVLAEQRSGTDSTAPFAAPGGPAHTGPGPLAPAFPALPSQAPARAGASSGASGPSLASIVTRAVLAPTSNALTTGSAPSSQHGSGHNSVHGSTHASAHNSAPGSGRASAAPAPIGTGGPANFPRAPGAGKDFPPLSPSAASFTSPSRTSPQRTTPPPGAWNE